MRTYWTIRICLLLAPCHAAGLAAQGIDRSPDWVIDAVSTNTAAAFGRVVAMDGDWLAISSPWSIHQVRSGSLLFWRRGTSGYALAQEIVPDSCFSGGGVTTCNFGFRVELDGNVAAVMSAGGSSGPGVNGLVHTYRLDGEEWMLADIIRAPHEPNQMLTFFGSSLALEDSTIAVGASGFLVPGNPARGAVHIFEPDAADRWLEVQRLIQPPPYGSDSAFGNSLSLENGVLVVGSPGFGWRVGVYKRVAGVWNLDQTIVSPVTNGPHNNSPNHNFGANVALDPTANVLAIADYSASRTGPVFVYERDPVTDRFELADILTPTEGTDPGFVLYFGVAIGVSNGLMAIAAPNERVQGLRTGAVEIYRREAAGWVNRGRLAPPQVTPGFASLGSDVAVSDSRVLTSDTSWGPGNGNFFGQAYLWEFSSGTEVCAQAPDTPALELMYDEDMRTRLTASVSNLRGRGIGVFVAGFPSLPVAYGAGELCVSQAHRISEPIPFVDGQEWIYASLRHPDWTAPQSTVFQFVYSRRDGVFPQATSSARVVD